MWGIWCIRSPQSVAGYGAAWMRSNGAEVSYATEEEAAREAKRLNNEARSANVTYFAKQKGVL